MTVFPRRHSVSSPRRRLYTTNPCLRSTKSRLKRVLVSVLGWWPGSAPASFLGYSFVLYFDAIVGPFALGLGNDDLRIRQLFQPVGQPLLVPGLLDDAPQRLVAELLHGDQLVLHGALDLEGLLVPVL